MRALLCPVRASSLSYVPSADPCAPSICRLRPLPQPYVPPHYCLHLHLALVHPLDLLEMLAWKSTSPLPMPCQPTVLTEEKRKNKSKHVIMFLHEYIQ
jgi:hypothetical protein